MSSLKQKLEAYYKNKQELKKYRDLYAEEGAKQIVINVVDASTFPYKKHPINIAVSTADKRLLELYNSIIYYLEVDTIPVENFVELVENEELREIFKIAYFQGGHKNRWKRVEETLRNGVKSESHRKRVERYLKGVYYD